MISNVNFTEVTESKVTLSWEGGPADCYRIYWADADYPTMRYAFIGETKEPRYELNRSTHVPHFIKISAVKDGVEGELSQTYRTPVKKVFHEQLEKLSRGLIAVKTQQGVFLSWRLMLEEVSGHTQTGLSGTDFIVYKNGRELARVTDSTNYEDAGGTVEDSYSVAPVNGDNAGEPCDAVKPWTSGDNYIDIPLRRPEGGITPAGTAYEYNAGDMSVGDADGDGEYEYYVKWDPSNAKDVSHKGYTGPAFIDCYKLNGRLLWRLELGKNVRAGSHYTQFMVYDFDGDGRAEMAVKTAPGTRITHYREDGTVLSSEYITLPEEDVKKGISHEDNFVCSAEGYRAHLAELFLSWHMHPEVKAGHWPATLEECFNREPEYSYPLSKKDAEALADYFIHEFAPSRSPKNQLDNFEGFVYDSPEYLTMFSGDGHELETVRYPHDRVDDGLMWGDYATRRIEPCNRVDRFLTGVAYLDGEHPYLLACRGYYTRTCIAAYRFAEGHFQEYFKIDSGFMPMSNPFTDDPHSRKGTDPVYGILCGQGNHSLATADVDGDGCQEIIYGAAVIDHDGSVLYSLYGYLPDGTYTKFGHGDAMHTGKIDPDRPGLQTFSVYENGTRAPYGYALRDAGTGEVIFGEPGFKDLGRCMVGDVDPSTRGLQVWVDKMYSCTGKELDLPLLGTNQSIRWAADMSTQIIDSGHRYEEYNGQISDLTHGVMLDPEGVTTNNSTKGNPCLVADLFGDFREEICLRKTDSSAIRIFTNTEITAHKLFTLMHDTQYRTSVAWQNNCYNQPGYTKFYYASDMDWAYVLPALL